MNNRHCSPCWHLPGRENQLMRRRCRLLLLSVERPTLQPSLNRLRSENFLNLSWCLLLPQIRNHWGRLHHQLLMQSQCFWPHPKNKLLPSPQKHLPSLHSPPASLTHSTQVNTHKYYSPPELLITAYLLLFSSFSHFLYDAKKTSHMPLLHSELKQAVLDRQREYKMAAIHAKQGGNIDLAKQHYLTAKVTESMLMLSHKSIYLFVCM